MANTQDPAGVAALTICEALILALNDRHILPARELMGLLSDAAATHEQASREDGQDAFHKSVADMINKMIDTNHTVLGRR